MVLEIDFISISIYFTRVCWYVNGIEQAKQNIPICPSWYYIDRRKPKHLHHNFDTNFYFKEVKHLEEAPCFLNFFWKCLVSFGRWCILFYMGHKKFIFFMMGAFVINVIILKNVKQLEWNMFKKWSIIWMKGYLTFLCSMLVNCSSLSYILHILMIRLVQLNNG